MLRRTHVFRNAFALVLALAFAGCADRHVEIKDRRFIRSCGSHGPHCGVDVSGVVERPDGTPYDPVVVALLGGDTGSIDQRYSVTRESGAFRLFTYGLCTENPPVLVVAESEDRVLCALPAESFGFRADGIRIVMNADGKCGLRMPEARHDAGAAVRDGRRANLPMESAGQPGAGGNP